MIEEQESVELERFLGQADDAVLAVSRVAVVEVSRATALADPSEEVAQETSRMLASCLLVDVSHGILASARTLASREVRTLDAIHLATAMHVRPDDFVAYDRRLLDAAEAHGLTVSSPGS